MNVIFRATDLLLRNVRHDLGRRHAFAAERVGFISARAASTSNSLLLEAISYFPVADVDYVNDRSVGAMMGQEAIRKALNIALMQKVGVFHVHMHEHKGQPGFSRTDLREQAKFIPDFFKVCHQLPHGAIVLSHDQAAGRVWLAPDKIVAIPEFNVIGNQTVVQKLKSTGWLGFL